MPRGGNGRADHSGLILPDQRRPTWSIPTAIIEYSPAAGDSSEPPLPRGGYPMTYRAPVSEIAFMLKHAAGFAQALHDGIYGDLGEDTVDAVLEEAGKFASEVIAPLNVIGDRHGVIFKDGAITTAPGWKEAYQAWAAAGWNGLAAPEQWGGQQLPHALNFACLEMWNSAAMAFGLAPLLTMGTIDALTAHGSETLQETYLPKLVSGE